MRFFVKTPYPEVIVSDADLRSWRVRWYLWVLASSFLRFIEYWGNVLAVWYLIVLLVGTVLLAGLILIK